VCNVALMVGDRFLGWRGAFAALAGMIALPLVIVLALTALYAHYSQVPAVAGALRGMGAVAAGMFVGTALRLVGGLRQNPMGVAVCAVLGVFAFAAVALLRLPLVWVLLGAGGAAWIYAYRRLRAANAGPTRPAQP
jgi:chromate transporter